MLFDTIGNVSYHAGDKITSGVAAPNVGNRQLQSLIDANPYRNASYTVSPWNQFLSWLGFRTSADAWRENMAVQAQEYDAAIMQKQYDQEYNDPASQVDRMRQAGLNPDIDGGSNISSGQAAPLGEDPSTPMMSSGDEAQVAGVVNGIMSAFSTALGFVSSVQGIHRSALSNTLLDLEGDQKIADFAERMAPTFLVQPGQNGDMNVQDHLDAAYNRAVLFSRKNLPKKFRDRFNSSVENFFSSAPGEATAYREWFKGITSSKDYYSGKHEFYAPDPETMDILYKRLGEAREKLAILGMKREGAEDVAAVSEANAVGAEAENREKIAKGIDSGAASSAINAENRAKKNQADVTNILRGTVNDILSDLKNDKSEFSGFFRFLLSCYSLYMFTK